MCLASSTCWVARNVTSSSLPSAPTSPENFVVIRSSATISEPRTNDTSERSSIACPLLAVGGQVDVPGAPLALLPMAVERLRVVQMNLVRRFAHAGGATRLARAHDRRGCLRVYAVGLAYLDIGQPGVGERLAELRAG